LPANPVQPGRRARAPEGNYPIRRCSRTPIR
jgi:hypothetical protein